MSIQAFDPSNGGTENDRTIKFIDIVRDQEVVIQENGKMSEVEKRALLILSSISRHTAGYRFNQTRVTDVPTDKVSVNMIQLSTLGASAALLATNSEEVGVGTAILSAYVASGRAN